MITVKESKLSLDFEDGWIVDKYDSWAFYRHQVAKISDGTKAMDFIAIDPAGRNLWLIELKDYREHSRSKKIDLAIEIAIKARDTLAGLMAARANAVPPEQDVAKRAVKASHIRLAVHFEQPKKHSKLFPRAFDRADVEQSIRRSVKAVDPHPVVIELASMSKVPWDARST